jgi:hypothetical protein
MSTVGATAKYNLAFLEAVKGRVTDAVYEHILTSVPSGNYPTNADLLAALVTTAKALYPQFLADNEDALNADIAHILSQPQPQS